VEEMTDEQLDALIRHSTEDGDPPRSDPPTDEELEALIALESDEGEPAEEVGQAGPGE
jgi:hypothetical protein